jgi:sugar lactone lactonase YvrE
MKKLLSCPFKGLKAVKINPVLVYPFVFFLFIQYSYGQNFFNNPESAVYDSLYNRYIVSNWGDGSIIQIDSAGNQKYFSDTLMNKYRVAGLYIYGDTLLAAAGDAPNSGLVGFNLRTDKQIFHIILPDIGLPNDITTDLKGNIYVTDYWGDKLYKIDYRTVSILIKEGLNYPNGLIYDEINDRLIILSVGGKEAPLLSVDLQDTSLSVIFKTGLIGGTDGITVDREGNYYLSEWEGDNIYRLDKNLSAKPEIYSSGHNDPADIYFDRVNNILVVPNFGSNTVDFIPIH